MSNQEQVQLVLRKRILKPPQTPRVIHAQECSKNQFSVLSSQFPILSKGARLLESDHQGQQIQSSNEQLRTENWELRTPKQNRRFLDRFSEKTGGRGWFDARLRLHDARRDEEDQLLV